GERLLDEHVLAGADGHQRVVMVVRVWGGDVDSVDLRVVHELLIAAVVTRDAVVRREPGGTLRVPGPDGDDLLPRVLGQGAGEGGGDSAGGDDAPAQRRCVARIGHPGRGEGGDHGSTLDVLGRSRRATCES